MVRRPPRSTLFPYTTLLPILPMSIADNLAIASLHAISTGPFIDPAKESAAVKQGIARLQIKIGTPGDRSEEHTSELQSLTISYAVFCLKNKTRCHRRIDDPAK